MDPVLPELLQSFLVKLVSLDFQLIFTLRRVDYYHVFVFQLACQHSHLLFLADLPDFLFFLFCFLHLLPNRPHTFFMTDQVLFFDLTNLFGLGASLVDLLQHFSFNQLKLIHSVFDEGRVESNPMSLYLCVSKSGSNVGCLTLSCFNST